MMADNTERTLLTKPLTFSGTTLHLNFETSAFGSVYVDVLSPDGQPLSPESCEIYGNSLDRKVLFPDNSGFAAYADQPVCLRFRLREAKLYSMWFTDSLI